MQARWIDFAKGGAPWAGFTSGDRSTLVIDKDDSVVDDLDRGIRAAWGDEILSFR
jgi:para-nitrobenzyl esterase